MRTILFFTFLIGVTCVQAAGNQQLAAKVIELRKQVELLNDEYKTEREKVLSELKALTMEKAELSSQIRNESIRKQQLDEKVQKLAQSINQSTIESKDLKPLVFKTLESLEAWVEKALPFKTEERLNSLTAVKSRLEKNEITATKAANELWALIEDEKRLSRETSLHKQSIMVDGKLQLAEVAKVGMLFLYFKTESGQVGMVENSEGQWTYRKFTNEDKKTQTVAFFQSLKQQIRQGYFDLPTKI